MNKFLEFGGICPPMETKIQIKKENQPIIYYNENKNTQYIFYGRNKNTQYIFYARKIKMMKNVTPYLLFNYFWLSLESII